MTYSTEEKLMFLMIYFGTRRIAGHTKAMLDGVRNTDNAMVLTHDMDMGREIQRMCQRKVKFVSWAGDLNGLKGASNPLVIDNAAMTQILSDALNVIKELRSENRILSAALNELGFPKKEAQDATS